MIESESWFFFALASATFLALQSIGFRQLQKIYKIPEYMAIVWLSTASFLLAISYSDLNIETISSNLHFLLIAGISSWAGMYAYNRAIMYQTNIGYVEGITAVRLILLYLISVLFFQGSIEVLKIIGVMGMVLSVYLIASKNGSQQSEPTIKNSYKWITPSFAAGILFVAITVSIRLALDGGVSSIVATGITMLISGLGFLFSSGRIRIGKPVEKKTMLIVFVTCVAAIVGNATLFKSYELTPNLAYAVSVSNFRMIILYLIAIFFQHSNVVIPKTIGVILAFICLALLA